MMARDLFSTHALRPLLRLALLPVLWAEAPGAPASSDGTYDRELLQRVVQMVMSQTTRRLIDRSTGETFTDSRSLPLKPDISIESKFNAWYYQTWLLTDGMRRAGAVLGDSAVRDYGERNLEFLYAHLNYFERQHLAGLRAAPVGDGKLSPIGFHFSIVDPWHTGLAPLVMEAWARTRDERYRPFLRRMDAYLAQAPTTPEDAIYRPNGRLMADDPYMLVPYLVRLGRMSGEGASLDRAVNQVLGARRRLFDSSAGLYRHGWHVAQDKPLGLLWGRANGWMILAQVELLAGLSRDHPLSEQVRVAFAEHAAGLFRVQDSAGGWHQVLDHPESWIETSCTGMFVYGLARGVNENWLARSRATDVRRGWEALRRKVAPDGDIVDVCGSTDIGDLKYYLDRPRLRGDLHGFGPFLLAASEMIRMREADAGRAP